MSVLEAAQTIITRLREQGHVALLAGGCVRDQLLGLSPTDYDVATDATPPQIVRVFRRTKQVGAQFGVILVRMGGHDVEVATFRTDRGYSDGRRPDAIEFTTPEEDARRRDFTINGMFLDPLAGTVIDYVGGQQDLADSLIRCIGVPEDRFAEDHLRMLRAVRFAARLGFRIEPATHAAIVRLAERITLISAERIRMELELILAHPTRAEGWRLIVETGLHDHLICGMNWTAVEAERVRRILAALPATAPDILGLAGLLYGAEPPQIRAACSELRCSTAVQRGTEYIAATSRRVQHGEIVELADVKLLMGSGHATEVLALARAAAGVDGTDVTVVERVAQRAESLDPQQFAPPPLVSGDDLLAMQLKPGPRYRQILNELYRAQLNEQLTTRDVALARAREMADEGR